jgi:hypothetical protein
VQESGEGGFTELKSLMGKAFGDSIVALREFGENKKRIAEVRLVSDDDVKAMKEFGDWIEIAKAKTFNLV